MSVYVDSMQAPYGRMVMCHCWADTRGELFAMMEKIGVQLKWFQRPETLDALPGKKASWEHFDISMTKRALAVQNGAIETDKYGPIIWESTRKFIAARDFDTKFRHLRMLSIAAGLRLRYHDK